MLPCPPCSRPPARLELALAPTPLLKLDRLSRRLGVDLYVKRDDLTGLLESGSKVRLTRPAEPGEARYSV